MKNNSIINLFKYDFKRVLRKKYIIVLYLIVIAGLMISSGYAHIENYKVWDISLIMQTELISLTIISAVFSIYMSNVIFFDMRMGSFVNIRMKNKRQWITSKIITIVVMNLCIILSMVLVSIIIGALYGGLSLTWVNENSEDMPIFFYKLFYSPYKIIFINIMTFTFFVSSSEVISWLVCILFKNYKVGIIAWFIYIISSPILTYFGQVKIKKYLSFTNYILFGNRNYLSQSFELQYLTVKQALSISMILFAAICVSMLIMSRKLNIDIGAKKNGQC